MTRYQHLSQALDFCRFRWLFVCVLVGISSTTWAEENSIQGISTTQHGATMIVRVAMKAPAEQPTGRGSRSRARLASLSIF